MKDDELLRLQVLNKWTQIHFSKGEKAAAMCCWQEARAIEIVHQAGDFSILEDAIQMHGQELINMAQFFYDNEKEDWGGILANMVGLFRAMSISGPMSDRIKTQKNRECAQGPRGDARFLLPIWNTAIQEELCKFDSEGMVWTYELLHREVESNLFEQGLKCPSYNRIKELTPDICKRYGFVLPSKGKPLTVEFDDKIIEQVKSVVCQNPKLGAKGVSDVLNEQGCRLEPNKVRLIFKRLGLDSLDLRMKASAESA
ncbi:hypothetical protein [Vibrio parahaemolyticus]|uniref:hypothetical protein n=2 Tax=Vibrionaceae TaxID=641 RepID=UPI0028DAF05B|nr:hypothetical protein [Vibrio parahaemolyticus]